MSNLLTSNQVESGLVQKIDMLVPVS